MTIMRTTKRRLAYAVTITLAGFAADQSAAQFVPLGGYAQAPQQVANGTQQGLTQQGFNQQSYQNQQAPPVYNGQQYQVAQAPSYQAQQYQQVQQPLQTQQPTLQQYQQAAQQATQQTTQQGFAQAYPNQYRVAMGDKLPTPPAETVQPIAATPQAAPVQHYANQQVMSQQVMGHQSYPQHVTQAAPSSDCGCNTNAQPSTSWESYVAAPTQSYSAGCATGDCSTGDCGTNYSSYGSACAPACDVTYQSSRPKRQWFGGIYGLYMTRDNPGKEPVSVLIEDTSAITTPYYPAADQNFLFTSQADVDAEWGYEFRFGSTFGSDPCGCNQQPFAWEIGYWSLNENDSTSTQLITTTISAANLNRIYTMKNYAGLEYDRDGAGGGTYGYRPLNDYYDYQMPVENNAPDDVRVVGVRTRQSFEIENLELNFWRFGCPVETPGLGAQRLASGMGGGGCNSGSCGAGNCGTGSCGTGCNTGCASSRPPRRFFINGLMGVRYVKIDENWQNAIQFTTIDGAGDPNAGEPTSYEGFPIDDDNVLFHDIEADNEMVGFQLGCSMNWLVGCKWNFFADSNFGIYGNQVDVYQRVYSGGGGTVRFVGDGTDAAVRSSDNNVAFLGELRAGAGYQISCNCRLTAAYRLISMSGVALAVEQNPNDFSNAELVSHIDSNDSILLHGLQTGIEFKY